MLDITPCVIGVETAGGVLSPVVPRNSVIPSTHSRVFAVPAASASDARNANEYECPAVLRVFEGVRPWTEHAFAFATALELRGLDRSQRTFVTVTIALKPPSLYIDATWSGTRHNQTRASVTMPLRHFPFDDMVEAIDRAEATEELDKRVRAFLRGSDGRDECRDYTYSAIGLCPADGAARGANATASRQTALLPFVSTQESQRAHCEVVVIEDDWYNP